MKILMPFISKYYRILFLGIILPFPSFSQGLILNKKAYDTIQVAKISTEKGEIIPAVYSLKEYTPYVKKTQGNNASCVGWSIANALTTYRAYLAGNCHRGIIDDNKYSASFIYNLINETQNCASGASFVDGLNLIREKGVCYDSSFDSSISCDVMPNQAHFEEAATHKLTTNYKIVFENKGDRVKNTKLQLAKGNPVMVGFSVVPGQRALRGQEVWSPDGKGNRQYGHAMVVIGYEKNYFQLMNSYGESWGKKGFIKISYDDYKKYAEEGYVLEYKVTGGKGEAEKEGSTDTSLQMSGNITISSGSYNEQNILDYHLHSFRYDTLSNKYKLSSGATLYNEFLQLKIKVPKGTHAYLLNVDNGNYLYPLWEMEATSTDTIVNLPTTDKSYQFTEKGKERLCLLYSYQELSNFDEQINKLESALINDQSLEEALQSVWKDKIIPTQKIDFSLEEIEVFSLISQNDGHVLPVILELDILSE